jgi:hypothetical protein
MAWELIVNEKTNQDFRGHAEKCGYSFSLGPEQVPGTRWAAQQVLNSHVQALADQNSILLELRMWEDTSPTWETKYYAEVVASASPLIWGVIIGGALLLMIGFAILFAIEHIDDIAEYIGNKASGLITWVAVGGFGLLLIGIMMSGRKT